MTWLGNFDFGSTVFHRFTTVNSTGAPTALSSAGVTVYRDDNLTQSTSGVVLTADYDSITGLNSVQIDMSTAGIYGSAGTYTAIISSGAASEDLTGYVVAEWSLRDRFVLSTAGLETLSSAGLETLSSVGLETLSSVGLETLSSAGLETLSSAGLETLSSAGLETASGFSTHSSAGLETLSSAGLETLSSAGLETLSTAAVLAVVSSALQDVAYEEPVFVIGGLTTAPSISLMLRYMYSSLRNQIIVSASGKIFYGAAENVLWLKVLSQDTTDSTGIYTEAEASTST